MGARRPFAQAGDDLHAVKVGQPQIEDHQVRMEDGRLVETFLARRGLA